MNDLMFSVMQERPNKQAIHGAGRNSSRSQFGARLNLDALTGVRFFAALYVVLYHSKVPETLAKRGDTYVSAFLSHGVFAVQLFFMLSGFILAFTYTGRIGDRAALAKFWEARFARIWPLYFVSLIASSWLNHTTPRPIPAIETLLMLQSWNPLNFGAGSHWNFVCWTLSCEAFFYLLFPFMQRKLQNATTFSLNVVLLLSLGLGGIFCVGDVTYATPHILHGIPLCLVRLPDFVAGVCLGNVFVRLSVLDAPTPRFTWLGLLSAGYCLSHGQRYLLSCTGFCLAALLFGLASERSIVRKLLSFRVLLVGGAISYAMYLFQWPVKALVKDGFDRFHPQTSADARFLIYLPVLLLISAVLYFAVEEPARKGIRHGFGLRRPRPVIA